MTAVKVLAGIILVLGVITVAMVAMAPAPADARTANVPNMEAMTKAQTPVWLAILNPIIGIVGAMIGGRMRKAA
jgi:Mn2+/Fe2+ NRAMP family transporter